MWASASSMIMLGRLAAWPVGQLSLDIVPKIKAMADMLVLPHSEKFTTPHKIDSYMDSETPIAAADPATRRAVLDNQTAKLTPPTYHGLTAGTVSVVRNAELATERIRAVPMRLAHKHAHKKFQIQSKCRLCRSAMIFTIAARFKIIAIPPLILPELWNAIGSVQVGAIGTRLRAGAMTISQIQLGPSACR